MSQIIGIYKITSPTNKIYIGKSKNIISRWKNYKSLNCYQQPIIHASLKRHGVDKHRFEIIEECDFNLLDERELYWYNHYLNNGHIMLNAIAPNELNPDNDSWQAVADMEIDGMTTEEAIKYLELKELRIRAELLIRDSIINFNKETLDFVNKNPVLAINWIKQCLKEKQRLLNIEEKKS
jgi:hypothetical protein